MQKLTLAFTLVACVHATCRDFTATSMNREDQRPVIGTLVHVNDECASSVTKTAFGWCAPHLTGLPGADEFYGIFLSDTQSGAAAIAGGMHREGHQGESKNDFIRATGNDATATHETKICECFEEDVCSLVTTVSTCAAGTYAIPMRDGTFVCIEFHGPVPVADSATFDQMHRLEGASLVVSINSGNPVTFDEGLIATSHGGTRITGLYLYDDDPKSGLIFSSCGYLIIGSAMTIENGGSSKRKKRDLPTTNGATGGPAFAVSGSSVADPHLKGAHGITFDVFGEPGANYSLVLRPRLRLTCSWPIVVQRCAS
jgi:hypothetical protein